MYRQIQVGNLSDSVDDRGLAALFAPFGAVHLATVAKHLDAGKSTGVGLVEMEQDQEGDAAVAALSGREDRGRILAVSWSRPEPAGPKAGDFGDRGGTDRIGD